MSGTALAIPDVVLFEPEVFVDERGFFFESFHQRRFEDAIGRRVAFVQDNHARSSRHVLRGMHYQIRHAQGKLVRVVQGEVFDVALDMRRSSPTFGHWVGQILSAENRRQMWIPEGFAHGYLTLSESAEFVYKSSDYYQPHVERCVQWDDPALGIAWPLPPGTAPTVSAKDSMGSSFAAAEAFA